MIGFLRTVKVCKNGGNIKTKIMPWDYATGAGGDLREQRHSSKWQYILKNITKTHHIFSFLRTVQGPGIQGSIQWKKMRHHRARTVISKKSESPKFIRQTCIFKLILEYFEIRHCTKSSSNRLSTKYVVLISREFSGFFNFWGSRILLPYRGSLLTARDGMLRWTSWASSNSPSSSPPDT